CTTPPAMLGLAGGPGDVITTDAPVDDGSVVVVCPGVECSAHPTATSRRPGPKTARRVRGFMPRPPNGPSRIERATETSQERNRVRRALDPVSRWWIIRTKLLCGRRGMIT